MLEQSHFEQNRLNLEFRQ